MPLIKVLSTEPNEILSSQEFHSLWTVRVGLLLVGCVDDLVDAPGARERKIYLDRENSRPLSQATVEAMGPYFQDNKTYGNPTSLSTGLDGLCIDDGGEIGVGFCQEERGENLISGEK